jgi:hypothetical protein
MFSRCAFSIFVVALWAALLPAQSQISSADLKGNVTDPSGAGIPNATVTATSQSTNQSRSATTDMQGNYRLALLPPDIYEIRTEARGFATQVRRDMAFTVGETAVVNSSMTVAGLATTVEVVNEGPAILEPERTHQANTLIRQSIENLPINGRNFLSFTLLTAGVVEENPALTNSLLPQLPTSRLSFAGQNGRSNSVMIDGVSNNDIQSNGVRPTISQEAVQEFQINRSSFNSEFGGASGGTINIVTKSGTNRYRGNVFGFLRNERLDARNTFSTSFEKAPPFKRTQAGFTLGGPLKLNQTFFFASYEALLRRESTISTILSDRSILDPTPRQAELMNVLEGSGKPELVAQGQTLRALLTTSANSPFPNAFAPVPYNRVIYDLLANSTGPFPSRQTTSTGSFRIDHAIRNTDQAFLRYTLVNDSTHGQGIGGQAAPSAAFDLAIHDHALVLGESHEFSSRSINEFRLQLVREVFNVDTVDPFGPRISIAGIGRFGREFTNPSDRIHHRYQVVDNWSFLRGRHNFKAGVDLSRFTFTGYGPTFLGGEIDFARLPVPAGAALGESATTQLATLLATPSDSGGLGRADLISVLTAEPMTVIQQMNFGMATSINQGFGDPFTELAGYTAGAYWQDAFQITNQLHLNYGLRYDIEFQPVPVNRDANNFAPRLGFAFNKGRTIIRGGGGIYFQPLYTVTAFAAKILGKNQQITNILVSASPELTPIAPTSVCGAQLAAGTPPSFCFFQQLIARGNLTVPSTGTIPESAYLTLAGLTRDTSTNKITFRLDDNAVDSYSVQSSLGVDHEIARDWNVSVSYLFNRGLHLVRTRQVNALPDLAVRDALGRPALVRRADSSLLANFTVETAGASVYHGLATSLEKRGQNYQLLASYTLGKAIDDATDINIPDGPENPTNTRADRSLSTFDLRHRLVISGVFNSPFRSRALSAFTVAPIFTWHSGFPFNITTGIDTNMDNNTNDRPLGVGRNTGVGLPFYSVDLRIGRRFELGGDRRSLDLILDIFNAFNRANYKEINGSTNGALLLSDLGITNVRVRANKDLPPTALGGPTSAYDPRILQVGAKINF